MAWTKKQKKALEAEIMLMRKNADNFDHESLDAMIMSEWPLCMASMPDCSDCPVMIHTGIANCLGSKLGDLSRFYALRRSGAIDAETFSKKLTEGADLLEDEVLCGPWSYKKRIERNRK